MHYFFATLQGTMTPKLRQKLLKIDNALIGTVFVSQAITGIGHELFSHEVFEALHGPGGLILVAGVALHVYLNWNWIRTQYLNKSTEAKADVL